MDILFIALIVGACGGLLSSLLGWAESNPQEAFNMKKFASALIRAMVGGIVVAVIFPVNVVPKDLVLLFLSAMGIDVSVNSIANVVKKATAT